MAFIDSTTRYLAEHACARLICSYAIALDNRNWDDFVELFTADAVWQRPSLEPILGHAGIRKWTREWPPRLLSRHITSNIVVTVESPDNATARSCATVYRFDEHAGGIAPASAPRSIVDYRDRFRLTPHGWRFAYREYNFIFQAK